MKLDDLCEIFDTSRFPSLEAQAHPERNSVLAARSMVTSAVADDEFLADCISLELRRLEEHRMRRGLVPFFIVPDLGVRFAFGYWPPGWTPGPHEHTAWTITAVCRNHLEVLTYDREESYKRRELVQKNRFPAPAGKVGYIYEPCIHEPRNTTGEWSLSLHVFSPRDGERLDCHEEPLPSLSFTSKLSPTEYNHPYMRAIRARKRLRYVHQLARILISMDVPQAGPLLEECFNLASSATRRFINGIVPSIGHRATSESQQVLTRTHKDLVLSQRYENDMIALDVETANGMVESLAMSSEARDAIAFIARETSFKVCALPGNLSEEEQTSIGEVLEETGLFTKA